MPPLDAALVAALVAEQFPAWRGRPVRPILPGGWDNRSFRLGDDLLVRLPSAERYVAQVGKEQRWLPYLAPRLPLPECDAAACNCRYVHYSDRRSGLDRRATYDWTRERELGVVNRRSGRGRRSTDAVA